MTFIENCTSDSSKGAASEMLACAYLLGQGYHVFRSVSPACPVDGIAYRDETSYRFEVKTLTLVLRGQPTLSFAWPQNDEWDLLVLVAPNGAVHEFRAPTTYEPVRDALREFYELPPAPMRAKRWSGPSPRPKPELAPIAHGTWSGYTRHKREKSEVCLDCAQALEDFRVTAREKSLKRRRERFGVVSQGESEAV